jgi:hypothetical protein
MKQLRLIKLVLFVVLCGLSLWLSTAMADDVINVKTVEKIPPLAHIPDSLYDEEKTRFANQVQNLLIQLTAVKTAYAAYNAKTADEQTDAELNTIEEMRKEYIDAAKSFNEALAAEVAAEAQHISPGGAGQIARLEQQIASDEEAIRRLGFQKRAADFEEWSKLTEQAQNQFTGETLRILGRMALDEATIGLNDQASSLSQSLTPQKAEGLITRLGLDDNYPLLAENIRALAKAQTIKERTDVANSLVLGATKLVENHYELSSPDKSKAAVELICETISGGIGLKKYDLVSWQTRALVSGAELTTELGFAYGEQHIAESTIRDLDHMTEEQLTAVQKLSDVLRKHVQELKTAKQQFQP